MAHKIIHLIDPSFDQSDVQAIDEAIKNRCIGHGEMTTAFENKTADFLGVQGAVATSSGTAALYIALKTLGVKDGDQVILPAYTCLSLLNAIVSAGAEPVLVDNNYDVGNMDFNINVECIEQAVTQKTKVVILPYMFGTPLKKTDLKKIQEFGIQIIEDISLSLGVLIEDRKAGSFGHATVVSFNNKVISTGKGGMLLSPSVDFIEKARSFTGLEDALVSMRTGIKKGTTRSNFELGYEMGDIQAAVGLSQLKKLPKLIASRKKLASYYTEALSSAAIYTPHKSGDRDNIFFRYLVEIDKDILSVLKRGKEEGIEYGRGVYPPIHYLHNCDAQFPNAEKAINKLISIPLYPTLNTSIIQKILDASVRILVK